MSEPETIDDSLKCKYCGKGVGACGRRTPFFNDASLHIHEAKCKDNWRRKVKEKVCIIKVKHDILDMISGVSND